MRFLLDTHIILWALQDNSKLPVSAKNIILDDSNEIMYSAASLWEVTIKHMSSPDKMPLTGIRLDYLCKKMRYNFLPITEKHIFALETISRRQDAPKHNDPFDRMLLAQAKAENLYFLTHDSMIPYYDEPCVIYLK